MGKKGLSVLRSLTEIHGAGIVSFVESASNHNMREDYFGEISSFCQNHGIRFFERGQGPSGESNFNFAIGWRWLVKDYERLIVLHDSLLPRYRGFNPLVSCLINKEPQIGVSALYAGPNFDGGPIIAQQSINIVHPLQIGEAIELLVPIYNSLVIEICGELLKGHLPKGQAQDESKTTYSLWRDESDYRIDWSWDCDKICRHVFAVGFPYKGASALLNGRLVRIDKVEPAADVKIENRTVGKVIWISDECPVVVCGDGLLKITEMRFDDGEDSPLPLKNMRVRFL